MSDIEKYEKMLKSNQSAIKKLEQRGKIIAAVIKHLKSLESDKGATNPVEEMSENALSDLNAASESSAEDLSLS